MFQPPLFSDIHSIRVPLLKGSLQEIVLRAAPQTGKNSEIRELPEDEPDLADEINIVLVPASQLPFNNVGLMARRYALKRTCLRHICSVSACKPLLHKEIRQHLPLTAVVATKLLLVKGVVRTPLVWWMSELERPEQRAQHIASLFWYEENWGYPYWYAFTY